MMLQAIRERSIDIKCGSNEKVTLVRHCVTPPYPRSLFQTPKSGAVHDYLCSRYVVVIN